MLKNGDENDVFRKKFLGMVVGNMMEMYGIIS